jgi:sporulation protein YtfJ
MSLNEMGDYLKASLDGIKEIAGVDTIIGREITTPSGVTVIPVSKVTMGFLSGGIDLGQKHGREGNGGGGGTGMSITPMAFLTINSQGNVSLIPINDNDALSKIANLIERAPEIIDGVKGSLK